MIELSIGLQTSRNSSRTTASFEVSFCNGTVVETGLISFIGTVSTLTSVIVPVAIAAVVVNEADALVTLSAFYAATTPLTLSSAVTGLLNILTPLLEKILFGLTAFPKMLFACSSTGRLLLIFVPDSIFLIKSGFPLFLLPSSVNLFSLLMLAFTYGLVTEKMFWAGKFCFSLSLDSAFNKLGSCCYLFG